MSRAAYTAVTQILHRWYIHSIPDAHVQAVFRQKVRGTAVTGQEEQILGGFLMSSKESSTEVTAH